MDERPTAHAAAFVGLSHLYGATASLHAQHPAPNRIGVFALRPDRQSLHKGDDGRYLWARKFSERDHLEAYRRTRQLQTVGAGARRNSVLHGIGQLPMEPRASRIRGRLYRRKISAQG